MPLFRLTLNTLFQRKVWVIILLLVGVLPWFAHYFTAGSYNPTLLEPSRIHLVWMLSWIATLTWGLHQGSAAGNDLVQQKTGEFFFATGKGRLSQIFQIWLSIACFLVPISAIAFVVSGILSAPSAPEESTFWLTVNFQALILKLAVELQLLFLAIALGSRLGTTVGLLVPSLLAFASMGVLPLISAQENIQNSPVLNLIWRIAPHYDLADLSKMMQFKLGALPSEVFMYTLGYLLGYGFIVFVLSLVLFRSHRRPFKLFRPKVTSPILVGSILLTILCAQALQAKQRFNADNNPFGFYGSPLGMTFALILQGPADTLNHGGVTHDHAGHDDHDHDHDHEGDDHSPHDHHGHDCDATVTQSVNSASNLSEFLDLLGDAQNHRYNPLPISPEMTRYQHRGVASIMETAWKLDPTNPSNYDGMSLYLTTISKGNPEERLRKLRAYNQVTRTYAMNESWDPGPSLTAANSAMSAAVFAELLGDDQNSIAEENQAVRFFYDRARAMIRDRSSDGSYFDIPPAKREEFENQIFRLRSHLMLYENRKQ